VPESGMEAGILFQVISAETANERFCGSQKRHEAGARW